MLLLLLLVFIADARASCPEDYSEYTEDQCVKYGMQKTYAEAVADCRRSGGALASFHSKKMNDFVYGMDKRTSTWIGLSCDAKTGKFSWKDGSTIDFLNIGEFSCEEPGADKDHFMMRESDGKWVHGDNNRHNYVCLVNKADTQLLTCPVGYTPAGDQCLKYSDEAAFWSDAEQHCRDNNGHLISIHSPEMSSIVSQFLIESSSALAVLIGLQTIGGLPSWTDGSAVDYANFVYGMPNSLFGDCGAVMAAEFPGRWVSVHCNGTTKLPYICATPGTSRNSQCPVENTFTGQGEITSPGYPDSSDAYLTCEYFFAAPSGQNMQITFSELHLLDDDAISFFEGESQQPSLVITSTWEEMSFVSSTGNVVRMVYETDTANTGTREWKLQFTSAEPTFERVQE